MKKQKMLTPDTSQGVSRTSALYWAPPDRHRCPSQVLLKNRFCSAPSPSALPTSTPESTSRFGKNEKDAWPENVRSIHSVNFQARFSRLDLLRDFLLWSCTREGVWAEARSPETMTRDHVRLIRTAHGNIHRLQENLSTRMIRKQFHSR